MTSILDLMGNVQAGFERGRERGKQTTLQNLFSQAVTAQPEARPGLYSEAARVGGVGAVDGMRQALDGMDDRARSELGRAASAFLALPDDQKDAAYPALLAQAHASRLPIPAGSYRKEYAAGLQQFAQAFGGSNVPSSFRDFQLTAGAANLTPGTPEYQEAANIALGRNPRAVTAAQRPVTVNIGGRDYQTTYNPTTGKYEAASLEMPGSNAPPIGGPSAGDIFSGLDQAVPGLTVTSAQRTTEHNRDVGGVPNSYHLTGQARDILPPNAQQAPAVRQWAAQNGMEVIPEGDHWHIEPARRPSMPIVGNSKAEDAGQVEAAKYQAQANALPVIGDLEAKNEANKARAIAGVQQDTVAGIEANKQFGTDAAKTYQALQDAGRAGTKERGRLLILRDSLGKTYTGPGANTVLALKRVANAFGINIEGLGEAESARAISNQLALSLRNPAGGEGMPGAMSDADREFLRQSTPSLQNSPQGWKALVDIRIALANAAVEQAQYAEQLRRKGVPITDIPGMVQEYANQHPIFQAHDSAARRQSLLEKY